MSNQERETGAAEKVQLYSLAHPGSPSAVRKPKVFYRSGTWVALLGNSIEEGMVGFGVTVEQALRAFDTRYLQALRPPAAGARQRPEKAA